MALTDYKRGEGIVLYLLTGGDMADAVALYGPERFARYVRRYRDGGRRPARPWMAEYRGPDDAMIDAACALHVMRSIAALRHKATA